MIFENRCYFDYILYLGIVDALKIVVLHHHHQEGQVVAAAVLAATAE